MQMFHQFILSSFAVTSAKSRLRTTFFLVVGNLTALLRCSAPTLQVLYRSFHNHLSNKQVMYCAHACCFNNSTVLSCMQNVKSCNEQDGTIEAEQYRRTTAKQLETGV